MTREASRSVGADHLPNAPMDRADALAPPALTGAGPSDQPPTDRAGDAGRSWLRQLGAVIGLGEADRVDDLFTAYAFWRDVLSLTWDLRSVTARTELSGMLDRCVQRVRPDSLRTTEAWPPREVTRGGRSLVEVLVQFETDNGPGEGVVRLDLTADRPRAWTVLTTLRGLQDRPELTGTHRPDDDDFAAHFGAPDWWEGQLAARTFTDRDPAVLVTGAGQAGLTVAARLRALDINTLVIESAPRVGDNWRNRYSSLWLHNELEMNHLPYLPYPETWPRYLPKDLMASWLEIYAQALQLDVWTNTQFLGATWDESTRCWHARVAGADGSERTLRPRHVLMATGVSGAPQRPELPGLAEFRADVLHSSEFRGARNHPGHRRRVVSVVGNSGSDAAQDLHASGCEVTMVQRGSVTVVSENRGGRMPNALHRRGDPVEICDLINIASPGPAAIGLAQATTRQVRELDRELIAGLAAVGFRTDYGEDETGFGRTYQRTGGGHYLTIGCSELLASGQNGLLQHDDVAGCSRTVSSYGRGPRLRPRCLFWRPATRQSPPSSVGSSGNRWPPRWPGVGPRRGGRAAQQVATHPLRGPVVPCRWPISVPRLLSLPGPSDRCTRDGADHSPWPQRRRLEPSRRRG